MADKSKPFAIAPTAIAGIKAARAPIAPAIIASMMAKPAPTKKPRAIVTAPVALTEDETESAAELADAMRRRRRAKVTQSQA